MIESEEMRRQITKDITRWAETTKTIQYLREYDIPNLVSTILDDIYHITLSCGHRVRDFDEGISISFKDNDGEGGQCTTYGDYCPDCIARLKKMGIKVTIHPKVY